jgi:hypothetical protein
VRPATPSSRNIHRSVFLQVIVPATAILVIRSFRASIWIAGSPTFPEPPNTNTFITFLHVSLSISCPHSTQSAWPDKVVICAANEASAEKLATVATNPRLLYRARAPTLASPTSRTSRRKPRLLSHSITSSTSAAPIPLKRASEATHIESGT